MSQVSKLEEILGVLLADRSNDEVTFNSAREIQDYQEREFNASLDVMQIRVLLSIAESLEKIANVTRRSS